MSKIKPITFDPSGSFIEKTGISAKAVESLAPKMIQLRDEILKDDLALLESGNVPEEKQPLDAAFLEMPERLLADYQADREASELGQILAAAKRMRETVDKVVVLGIGGSYMGPRALMECCCQPYFNEYSRAERGGRPKMYFEGNNVDNDWSAGLLNLLKQDAGKDGPEGKWGIVVISKSGGTMETAASFRQFLAALKEQVGTEGLGELVIPVTGASGKLASLSDSIGVKDRFQVPDGVGGRFSVLSPVGLLPAAILGIDIIKLLEGAAAMNDHFRLAAPFANGKSDNVVLDYVSVNHLLEKECGCNTRLLSVWSKSLESAGLWYDQLLAESIGKAELGALPLTIVNTRDLHSRAQQHQEGRRDKVVNNVILQSWRNAPMPIGQSEWDQDQLNEIADRTLPVIMDAAIRGTNMAYAEDKRPTTDIFMPGADEASLGQYFQMMMLATVVEGRLLGINPYGQPGVEKYKKYMTQLLREPVAT